MRLPSAIPAGEADRIVPPSGLTGHLLTFVAAVMGFLAVFALALLFAADRVADRWADGLANAATIRVAGSVEDRATATESVLRILEQTPGVEAPRPLSDKEQADLLAPWLGPDLPVAELPLPGLIEFATTQGFETEGLRLRLAGEVPGAILDDHTSWRRPLVEAAGRVRVLGWGALVLMAAALAAMVVLAARAALAANARTIAVLRLIGARDAWVARAFTRRMTLRAAAGAAAGAAMATLAVASLPVPDTETFLTDLRFRGAGWLAPLLVPAIAAGAAYLATRAAARHRLRETR